MAKTRKKPKTIMKNCFRITYQKPRIQVMISLGTLWPMKKKLNSNVEKISSCHKKTNSQSNSWKLMTKKWACNTIFCRGLYGWVLENFRVIKLGMCTLFVWYTTTIENFYLDEQSNYTHAQFTLELIINKGPDIRSEYLR